MCILILLPTSFFFLHIGFFIVVVTNSSKCMYIWLTKFCLKFLQFYNTGKIWVHQVSACVRVCVCVCISVTVCVCVFVWACAYVCVFLSMSMFMWVCVFVCLFVWIFGIWTFVGYFVPNPFLYKRTVLYEYSFCPHTVKCQNSSISNNLV